MRFSIKKIQLSLLLAPCLLAACGDADEPSLPVAPPPGETQVAIGFTSTVEGISDPEVTASRSGIVKDVESIRVYAVQWNSDGKIDGYLMEDELVSHAKDGTWTTSVPYYWPDSTKTLSFFAYSPSNLKWEYRNPGSDPYQTQFFYEPPLDPKDQVDIITSAIINKINYSATPSKKVDLHFGHRLAQVVFDVKGDASQLRSITLKNVIGCGLYNFGESWDTHTYSDCIVSYTVDVPPDGKFGDDQRLMIIPQQTKPGCTIDVKYNDGTTKSVDFAWKTLHMGAVGHIVINLPSK
ncbi:MAG: fimbrillin family protein [Staphylococcus sp.]|nr:fimbrillin family protein [Staphylococcus sp.]